MVDHRVEDSMLAPLSHLAAPTPPDLQFSRKWKVRARATHSTPSYATVDILSAGYIPQLAMVNDDQSASSAQSIPKVQTFVDSNINPHVESGEEPTPQEP